MYITLYLLSNSLSFCFWASWDHWVSGWTFLWSMQWGERWSANIFQNPSDLKPASEW